MVWRPAGLEQVTAAVRAVGTAHADASHVRSTRSAATERMDLELCVTGLAAEESVTLNSGGRRMMTLIADWDGYATDREMDGDYWVPDDTEQPMIVHWHPREEYWTRIVHVGYMQAEVEFILPAAAAKRWGYVLSCPPPPAVAP